MISSSEFQGELTNVFADIFCFLGNKLLSSQGYGKILGFLHWLLWEAPTYTQE